MWTAAVVMAAVTVHVRSGGFAEGGDALADADAHGGGRVRAATGPHLV
jgi:hypothetical protein